MLRHTPVLAKEIYEHLPERLNLYFDGTFGHGGHVEYFLSQLDQEHKSKDLKVVACDIDVCMLKKGLDFTQSRNNQII
jgi:16S rRNA C1402 N4-methylase RsmH